MKFFKIIVDDGNSIKTECLIIKTTAPPRKSLDRSTRVWWFTSNSRVQRCILHIKEGKRQWNTPGFTRSGPRHPRPATAPERIRMHSDPPGRSSRPSPWQRPARLARGLAPHPGAMERAEPLQGSERYGASSRSVYPPSLLTLSKGCPLSVTAGNNHVIPAVHCCRVDPRGHDPASPVLA